MMNSNILVTMLRTTFLTVGFIMGFVNPANFTGLSILTTMLTLVVVFIHLHKQSDCKTFADCITALICALALFSFGSAYKVNTTQDIPVKQESHMNYIDIQVPGYGTALIRNVFSAEEKAIIASVATKYGDKKGFINILNVGSEDHKPRKGFPFCDMQGVVAGLDGFDAENYLKNALFAFPYMCARADLERDAGNNTSPSGPKLLPYSESITLIRDLTNSANTCFKAKVALTALDLDKDITNESAKNLRSIVLSCEKDKLSNEINKIK